ncbi:unnamed protein product [Meganyctiphanes norvegica]|uniref:G-protein coupled receptors family 1 profile domain-containing protein n=1 Tax=Meganyctiphanes norvegica TaxID=48144 RepID=A0AAV2QZK5_MEGNR
MGIIYNETSDFEKGTRLEKLYVYSVNLSDIITQIEIVDNIDIIQLMFECLISLFSIAANTLTLVVIWEVSLNHPAQALRAAMALSDLLQGLFGSGVAVWNHSYYLWCANQPERCNYTVNYILLNEEFYVLHSKLDFILSLIHWASLYSNNLILIIMTFDRYIAVCYPLRYHCIMSMRRTRIAIVINWMIPLIYWLILIPTQINNDMFMKSAYHPSSKMMHCVATCFEFVASSSLILIYVITIIVCMVALSILLLYQLNKASKISKSLREGMEESAVSTEAIDFNKILVISMMVEVLVLAGTKIVLYTTSINYKTLEISSSAEDNIIYLTNWFVLSSTFFNFIIYNLRIPAFRSQSLTIIKNWFKGTIYRGIQIKGSHKSNFVIY